MLRTSRIGHSEKIADGHYRQVTTGHYDRAISEPTGGMPSRAGQQEESMAQNPAQSTHVPIHQVGSRNEVGPENPSGSGACLMAAPPQVGDDGLEPPTSTV